MSTTIITIASIFKFINDSFAVGAIGGAVVAFGTNTEFTYNGIKQTGFKRFLWITGISAIFTPLVIISSPILVPVVIRGKNFTWEFPKPRVSTNIQNETLKKEE
jgi:hypothetical protein